MSGRKKRPKIGDIVTIKYGDAHGRAGDPPGPIKVKVTSVTDGKWFTGFRLDEARRWFGYLNYRFDEIIPSSYSKRKGRLIGGMPIQ